MPTFTDQTVGLKCCECDALAHTWAPLPDNTVIGGCLEHPEKVLEAMKVYGNRSASRLERWHDYGDRFPKKTY